MKRRARCCGGAPASSLFFTRFARVLAPVADRYDVVVVDCPPQLGYLAFRPCARRPASSSPCIRRCST